MKEVTEIKVGQVWLTKSGEPVMFHRVGERHSAFHGYEKNRKNFSSCPNDKIADFFDFVADSMSEEDFKQWCMTGVNPTLKSETEIKSAENDPVHHPSHYTSHPSGIECIEITRHMSFNIGNAIKYLWRNGKKDGQPAVQDLEKAIWYIQDEIKRLKGGE